MKREFRAHPLMIMTIIKPFLVILLIPVLRGVVQYLKNGEVTRILGIEIIIFALITLFGIVRWRAFRLVCSEKNVIVRDGIFAVREAVIPFNGLSSVQSEQSPFDYIFQSVTFRINTEAGSREKTDYSFKLSRKDAHTVSELLYGKKSGEPVRFSPFKIAILAAATSSAFTGLLVGVPILNGAAKLAGIGVNEVLERINAVSKGFEKYFPPAVNTATLILLASFAVSFIYSFLRHLKFRIFLNEDRIEVRSGFFVMLRTAFKKASVNNVMIEQTFLMTVLRRYAMKVNVGGYGETKSESRVLAPCGKYSEIKEMFGDYFPFMSSSGKPNKSKIGAIHFNRYIFWAEIYFAILIAAAIYFATRFEAFSLLVVFATFVIGAVLLYYTYLCRYEYKTCEARFGSAVTAKSKRGLRKCRFYCPKERVGEIKLYRYPPDMYFKTCNIKIITRSETADSILVRHLDFEETKRNVFECYGITE